MEKEKKKGPIAQQVWEFAQPEAEKLGLSLWDVQFVKEGADYHLRIVIDKAGGVGIDDCVDMTHAIDPILDEQDLIHGAYQLEVSSPGLDRKLVRPQHYEAFLGAPVLVKLIRPLEDGRREVTGILTDLLEGGEFVVTLEDESTLTFEKKQCSAVSLIDELWTEIQALEEEDDEEA